MSPMEEPNPKSHEPIDRDLLISRVVDDAASAGDWQQLRALAAYDPGVWRELFEAQHAQAELSQAVQQAIAIADGIDAPIDALSGVSIRFRLRHVASWAGWAVAASVAVIWVAPHVNPSSGPVTPVLGGNQAVFVPPVVPSGPEVSPPSTFEAFGGSSQPNPGLLAGERSAIGDRYRQASAGVTGGTGGAEHLAEMPERVLLEVRPLPDGRLELIYVRRLIEKAIVEDGELYQVKPDDAGIDRAVPYRQRRPSSGPI